MYAIKLKSDTENQRCINDHVGHNTKSWPDIDCLTEPDMCRTRETEVPEECDIFCCNEQDVDFICHAVAYSMSKGMCRMYGFRMEDYDQVAKERGLVAKNGKGDDWMYFYRKWDSQLHDIINLTMKEESEDIKTFMRLDWMDVYKADWYVVDFEGENMEEKKVIPNIMSSEIEFNTRILPYNSRLNMSITAGNEKTNSAPHIVELLTRPPPIDNLTIIASDVDVDYSWTTVEGSESFTIKVIELETGAEIAASQETKDFNFNHAVKPVTGYQIFIHSNAIDFYGNATEGITREMTFYSEFPKIKKVDIDAVDCDEARFSWEDVGYGAKYKVQVYDLDNGQSVFLEDVDGTNARVTGLENARKYQTIVYAFDENTRGDPAEIVFISELCKAENLFSPNQEDTAFELSWNPVELAQKYKIKIEPSPADGLTSRYVQSAAAYIEALTPGIQYKVSITAIMKRTDKVEVISKEALLFQYTKLLAPEDLCIPNKNLHNSSATLTWTIMEGADLYYLALATCRPVNNFLIRPGFYRSKGQNCPRWRSEGVKKCEMKSDWDQGSKYLMQNISKNAVDKHEQIFQLTAESKMTLDGLEPGTIYMFWLGGVNKQTYSERAEMTFITRLKTTELAEFFDVTHDSVKVKWKLVNKADRYSIIVTHDIARRKRVQRLTTKSDSTDIIDLHPNSPYLIEVIAENKISFSWPFPLKMRTKLAPTKILSPFKPPRGDETGDDYFDIQWTPVEGAESYEIEITDDLDHDRKRREGDHSSDRPPFHLTHRVRPKNLEEHQFFATGMNHNTEHEIMITAHNRFTDGSVTTERFFTRPHTPENFRTVEVYDDLVRVAWDACEGIWDYDINVYDDNNHVAKVVLHNKTEHEFKELIPNHHYIFVIRAYGHVVSHPATIKIFTKIQGVDYLTMTEVYDDTMKLDWKEANGASHYLVYFSHQEETEERVERTETSDVTLTDLTPNSIYTIKVVGMNANTEGMPMFTTVITKLGYIKKLRQDIPASTDKTIMMRWLQVPNADHFILKVTSKRTNKRIQVHKIPAKDSSLLIRDLRPATIYVIEIQAFSDISDSYPTDFSPQTKITPIKGFSVDFTSDILLRLIWNSFTDNTYHIAGDGRYWKIDTNDFQWIPDLVADTNYNFTIWATKDIYYSDNTTLTALTHMSAPTVNVDSRTHTVIKISWTQVPRADQYRIQYVDTPTFKKIVDSGREKTFRMRYLLSEDQNIRVRNLDPYTEYLFFVRAERGQQIGENGTVTDYTRLSPTQAIEIKSRTDKTSQLSWASVNGAKGYTIKYQAQEPVQNEELSIYVEQTKEKLVNLLPGSTYKLVIIAEAPETSGQPANDEFDTFLEAPEQVTTKIYDTYTKTICWNPVFMAEGYTMNYASIEPEDKVSRAKDFTDFVEGSETCGYIDDLLPGLKYQISIWGWNQRYDGMKSKYKSATLLEAPEDFEVNFYNNTQIEVVFAPVTRALRYELAHAKINSSDWVIDGETSDLKFPINSLTPFTEYDIKINPINKVTRGYESKLAHWSKLNPISNFQRIKLTPNQVTLKWDPVEHAVKYRVFYVSEVSNLTLQETDYAGIIITGLEETTLYNISVEPVAENQVPGVTTLYPVITEAKTVEDLVIEDIEPWRMILTWTGTEKAIAYEVHVNSTEYSYIMRVRTNRAFIRQLEPGIKQNFKVYVITRISRSQPVPVAGFTTLPLPDSARVTKITHSKVMTKWNAALEDWAPAFDDLYYRCVLIKDYSNETVVNTTTTELGFDFTNLELNTRYTIILSSESPDTSSDERIIEIRTLLPDSPDLDMNEINDENVVLTWNKTVGLNYAVYVKPLTCPADKVVICDIAETENVVVEGLVPACLYDLVIYGQICPKDRKLTIEDDRKRIANQMFYTKLESVTDIEIIEEDRIANFSWSRVPETSFYVIQWTSPELLSENVTKTSEDERIVAQNLQPNTLYEGSIWGTNPDTKSNPAPFSLHTKMTRVNATLRESGPDFLEYAWDKVNGAERYDFNGMPQFPGEDPFAKSTTSTSIKFDQLIDGSLYLIEAEAVNEDTTSVLSQYYVWTRLYQPDVVISNVEDTSLVLSVEHVDKATRIVGKINDAPIDFPLNSSESRTEIVLDNLEQGSMQSVKIQAVNDNCTSHFVEKNVMLLLTTPTNITVLPSADSVTLEWSAISKASNYLLTLTAENGEANQIEVRIPQYTFFGLSAGTLYKITIQAVNEETKSAEALIETYTRLDTLSQVDLIEIEPTSLSLEWNTVDGATGYEITVKQHYDQKLNLTESTLLFHTSNSSYQVTGLVPGAKYSYSVAGKNLNTVSDAEVFTIYTELENIPEVAAVQVHHNDMTVSWGFVPNAVEYVVELSDSSGRQIHSETVQAQETEWIANSIELKNLQPGAFYNVSLQAFNDVTKSNVAVLSHYTLLNPFNPRDVVIFEKRPEGIVFSWQPIAGADSYKIIIDKDFEFTYFMDRGEENPRELITNETSYDVTDLLPDTKYKYELIAFNQKTFSESFYGYEATLLPDIELAEVVEKTYASFKAKWSNVPGAADYLVQLRYTNGQVLFLTSLFKAEIDLRFGSLLPGVSYTLSIIGRNEITETRSKSLSVWTKLSPIINLRSNDDELQEDKVVLEWEDVPGTDHYHIVVLEVETDKVVFTENITESKYERKNLTAGTKYQFTIHAVNEFTESDTEQIAVATPLSKPTDYQISVFHPYLIKGSWKLGDALAPRHRRITWRCGTDDPKYCDCSDFEGCPGHYVLKKIRADGEKSWTPEMLGGGDVIEDSIQLDNDMVYRMCIRAENPQTGENSRPFCVTLKTGMIAQEAAEDQKLCIQRDVNWINPLEMIPAILNNGEWTYEQTPKGVIPSYNTDLTATCKKIGKVYSWDLKDFIRIHQKSCSPGWISIDNNFPGEVVQCLFPKHKSGTPIFPKSMIEVNYCEKRSVDPKRPWIALRNVANGGRCGCHYLKACERWDYKPFPGFTVRNAAPIITMPLVKNEQACLKKCDVQRERECAKIPQVVKEGKTNCVCKNCCLMTTLSTEDGCVLFTSSLNRTSTRIEARDQTTVFTNFLGAQGSPGFRLLDFTNNGVARPEMDYEVTLSFSYASETCVRIIFDQNNVTEAVYHDIIIRKGRDYSKSKPCMETYPTLSFYPVEHVIDYDLEEGETIKIVETYSYSDYGIYDSIVEITSTDDDQAGDNIVKDQMIQKKIGINQFGCQYPAIKIEGPWLADETKTITLPKSKKLILSATSDIQCEVNPGYSFRWTAKLIGFDHSFDNMVIDGNMTLEDHLELIEESSGDVENQEGSGGYIELVLAEKLEAALQPRDLIEGLWKVTIELEFNDLDFLVEDVVWINVIPSPLEIDIEGGEKRTAGHGKTIQFKADAIDPDESGSDQTKGIEFEWFILGTNATETIPIDAYFEELYANQSLLPYHWEDKPTDERKFDLSDMYQVRSKSEVWINTDFFYMNEPFKVILVCSKDIREAIFEQTVTAVAGDPPDFFIKCVENCKDKLNRGEVLSLMIKCKNCVRGRSPRFFWSFSLYDLPEEEEEDEYSSYDEPDEPGSVIIDDVPSMTATFNQRIMKVHKNYFLPGREYSIDVSVSMDGYDEELDQIVRQEASNQIVRKVNLPPINGHCIGIGGESTCDYITQEQYELVPNENATVIFTEDIPEAECSEACCFGEAINCLGYQFTAAINETNGNCTLFDIAEDDENVELLYVPEDSYFSRYNRRVFAKVEAVKGEVSFQCQDWFDEGTFLNYEEAAGRQPQLMYRFTTKPINESIDPFLLYHGPSPQTPKLSLPLGNKDFFFFGLRVVAEICDLYGECVDSNEILVQSFPMISVDVGGDLMNAVSGNSSKLLTAVSTKNPKIVASITGAVSSYFVQNISDISSDTLITTTAALTTVAATTRRLIFANNMPTPNPIVEGQPEEPLFDLSQVVARPVETDGIAAEEDSEEIAKQKAEEAERVRQWTIQMAAEASNFLSSGSLETQSSLSRRKRQVRDFIRKRARRSADYFYDEYQGESDNSSDYEMYEFSGISEQLYGPTESPIYVTTMSAYEDDLSLEVESSVKKGLKKELMNAMGSIVDVIVSPESLMQVSAAVSTFTETGDDLDDETQQKGADMAVSMTSNLKGFTEEANKEQLSKIGGKVMASLSGIVSTSTPDDQVLKEDKLAGKEPNFDQMEKRDINPIENEWMRKLARLENRKNIAEKAPAAKNITSKSLGSVSDLTGALTTKQMGGEEATEVESGDLSVNTQKISAEDASGAQLRNKNGVSIKLPEISEATTAALLEQGQEELDIQMSTFGKNPFKYDDDASLVNSAVTVLNMPNGTDDILKSGMGLAIPNDFSADNQMMELHFPDEGVLQVSRFEIVGPGNAILMVYEPPHLEDTTVHYEVFIRNGSAPVLGSTPDEHIFDFKFSLPLNLEIWEMENPAIDKYKVFIPENDIECEVYPCSWFVGSMYTTSNMTTPQQNRRKRRSPDLPDTTHHLFLSTPGCRVLNQETGKWSSNGCHVDSRSTPEYTECFCKDLPQKAIFSAEFFVPPNKIDFSTIWSKFCITCNAGVFSFVIVFLALWLIAAWFILKMDKNDAIKWALRSLIDNRREDKVLYQISVTTGGGGDSSTKSKIYFRLEGMRKRSRVRRLGTTKNAQLFERGTNKHFLMREAVDLGELKALQIWHDNSGRGALKGWYCQQVVVTHVQSNKRWFFMIQDYLDAARSDGKCERLVPPADPDEKQNFNKLFAATSWSKLSDDHIWLSTFHRPTKSMFKRMERWSCCACLTFITMLTNMMFAGQEDSSEMIRIGPFRFSPSAIYISAICSLIVVPATLIPITLFKKRKSKANDCTDNRAKGFLPWWSKYVAYGLNFCVTIICAFFVILYSMDFGKAKSDKWLLNELMSFCVNIVVAEPIKVVLISMFIASILRKLDQSFLDLIENTEIEQEDKRFLDLCCIEDDSGEAPLITPAPPNENDLNAAKELRYKEEKMVEIIWDIIAYFIYICIVIFLATGNRDPMAFAQNENIKNMLYYDKFEKVESVDDFWNWINSSVRDSIYPTHAYNGRKLNWRERAFMEDGASFRVGPARIRLQRGDPWSCRMYDEETDFPGSPEPRKRCDHGDEIKGNYDTGWHNEIDASTVDVDDIFEQAWIYRSWKELNGAPFQGDIGIYNGGGYSAELGVNPETCSAIVKYLHQNAFISHTASASFVEFTIYNTASNLFSKVQFVSEWLPSGNSVNNFKIDTFRLYHYEGTVGSMMVVAHIFFIAHMIFKIVSTIKDGFCKFGFWGVVKDNWKLFEVIMILLDILILIFYSIRMMVSDKLIDLFKDDKRSFVNFDPVVAADSTLGWIISFAVFFSILKFGKLLRFNQRIEMLSSVIKKIGQEWSGFFVMFMTVLMSFLSMAMIMWNKYSRKGSEIQFHLFFI